MASEAPWAGPSAASSAPVGRRGLLMAAGALSVAVIATLIWNGVGHSPTAPRVAVAPAAPVVALATAAPVVAPAPPATPLIEAAAAPIAPVPAPVEPVAPVAQTAPPAAPIAPVKVAAKEAPKETAKDRRAREAREREARAANAAAAAPAARGLVRIAVSPWGEVEVDGKALGASPPLTELSLPEGRHQIVIRNTDLPPLTMVANVSADQPVVVKHKF